MASASSFTAGTGWSPFARPLERHCEAVADALLKVVKASNCALEELDPATYSEYRRANPQLGLPRATTVASACGSWDVAVQHAMVKAAALHRESVAGGSAQVS